MHTICAVFSSLTLLKWSCPALGTGSTLGTVWGLSFPISLYHRLAGRIPMVLPYYEIYMSPKKIPNSKTNGIPLLGVAPRTGQTLPLGIILEIPSPSLEYQPIWIISLHRQNGGQKEDFLSKRRIWRTICPNGGRPPDRRTLVHYDLDLFKQLNRSIK